MSLPTRLGQWLLRSFWYGVIPALLAGLLLRRCVPAPGASGPAWLLALAEQVVRYPVPAFAGAFLVFAALLRYWRFRLPFGYCLAHLSPAFAASAPHESLEELESAALFRAWLTRSGGGTRLATESERHALADFDQAFAKQDAAALRAPRGKLESLLAPALKKRRLVEGLSFVGALALAAGAALYLRHSLLQNYSVLSSSMLPTFEKGDQLNANRRAYASPGALPARGDVVVFKYDAAQEVVKRVIGLPGDEIRMHGGFPIINGWEVPHCDVGRYVYLTKEASVDGRIVAEFLGDQTYLTLHVPPARPFESYTVKPGEVFVLGDNRNLSLDSRNWQQGEPSGLRLEAIVGKVEWLLIGHRRNGEIDYGSLFARLGPRFSENGIDLSALQSKLQICLQQRPQSTTPPPPAAQSLSQATVAP